MEHDENLMPQILSGNRNLFEQIVIEYQNLIYTVCLNIVRNVHDAENVAQETFLTAYLSLTGFRGKNLKSWLCRIAVNKSIDYKRKHLRVSFEDYDDLKDTEQPPGKSIEEIFERKETQERINSILETLPEKYAYVIKAHYYDGFAVKEIAKQMNMPERTVETQLYRAKKLLKERWGEYEQ